MIFCFFYDSQNQIRMGDDLSFILQFLNSNELPYCIKLVMLLRANQLKNFNSSTKERLIYIYKL